VHQLPITTLPALVSLRSDPNSIGELLMPTGAFPKLALVRVVIHFTSRYLFPTDDVEDSLAGAAIRLSETNLRFRLDLLPASSTAPRLGSSWRPCGTFPVLSHVREIVFSQDIVAPTSDAFLTWISKFPLLERIEFIDTRVRLDHPTTMSLLRRTVQKCAKLHSVRIGQDTYDVSAWLSSENGE
jgi:hypothetical protein